MTKTEKLKSWLYRLRLLSLVRHLAALTGAQRLLEQHLQTRSAQRFDDVGSADVVTVTNRAGVDLVVDPTDLRARQLATQGGALDYYLVELWQRLVREFSPQLVIDVGANYGEVLFGCGYPSGARVVGVEANSRLVGPLRATIERNGIRGVEVLHCAVSDRCGPVEFITEDAWTGRSRVVGTDDVDRSSTVTATTLDKLMAGHEPIGRLLVKVDVEGHEATVLRGMAGCVARSDSTIAVCEFINMSDADIEWMCERYRVYTVNRYTWRLSRVDPQHLIALKVRELQKGFGDALKDVVVDCKSGRNHLRNIGRMTE